MWMRAVKLDISMEQFIASFTCFAGVPGVEVVESETMIGLVRPASPTS
jgi:hypothetical protein